MSAPRWRAVPPKLGSDAALWRYVVAPDWVVAVPEDAPRAVLAELLALREGAQATLEILVSLLPIAGKYAVQHFAIAELSPAVDVDSTSSVTVIVRGAAAVDVFGAHGVRRLDARGIQPWLLSDVRDVTALSFSTTDARSISAAELPPPGATASAEGDGQWAEQGGAKHGSTLSGTRLDLVLGTPFDDEPGAASASEVVPVHRVRIAEEVFSLDIDSYVGRRPNAAHLTQLPARLVTVLSPAQDVSATHVRLSQDGPDVVVTDLGSTNGTLIELPDGSQLRLLANVATAIVPGSRIVLGEGVVLEVLSSSEWTSK